MIHEVEEWMFELPLHNYELTFDDALYTQYVYFDRIKKIDTNKIFFVSTGIVAEKHTSQRPEFIKCHDAHEKYFKRGDLSNYMNWTQIHEIYNDPLCEIGAHGHAHDRIDQLDMIQDTKLMIKCLQEQNICTNSFCFPYNEDNTVYKSLLLHKGFTRFYGKDRVCIYDI